MSDAPHTVLLTGATGFLGSHVADGDAHDTVVATTTEKREPDKTQTRTGITEAGDKTIIFTRTRFLKRVNRIRQAA